MLLKRIHHIDYVVRDLRRAIQQYERIFPVSMARRERLAHRGVELARFRLGGTWIILVQPVQEDSPVQRFLDQHGEGFYHIAYEVDDVKSAAAELKARGIRLTTEVPRDGLEGWKLLDIEREETLGVMTQLVQPV